MSYDSEDPRPRGWGSSEKKAPEVRPARCSADGAFLLADGFCPFGNGFSPGRRYQPGACPHCRGEEIEWSGQCLRCRGCSTARREDWSLVGDVYCLVGGHWRRDGDAPRRICPLEENQAALKVLAQLLWPESGARITVEDAHRKMAGIMEDYPAEVEPF